MPVSSSAEGRDRRSAPPAGPGARRTFPVRLLLLVPLLLLLLLVTCRWERKPQGPPGNTLSFRPIPLPGREALRGLGPFRLEAIWQLLSHHPKFGGYSALVPLPGGRLLAIGDRANLLRFSPPGEPPSVPVITPVSHVRTLDRTGGDSESATRDPVTGRVWIGWETKNAISRHQPGIALPDVANPPAMAKWPENRGAEAIVRLADGRFIVLREGFGGLDDDAVFGGDHHEALLFPGDPVDGAVPLKFSFVGPAGFYPVDIAQIPDGRVLILMRRLVWPVPTEMAVRIVVADPAAIRAGGEWRGKLAAKLNSTLPIDNFEGLAVVPRTDGNLTVWLISDANSAVTQRTLLWRMALDPRALPR